MLYSTPEGFVKTVASFSASLIRYKWHFAKAIWKRYFVIRVRSVVHVVNWHLNCSQDYLDYTQGVFLLLTTCLGRSTRKRQLAPSSTNRLMLAKRGSNPTPASYRQTFSRSLETVVSIPSDIDSVPWFASGCLYRVPIREFDFRDCKKDSQV